MSFLKKVAGIYQMPSAESLATSEVSNGSGYGTRSVPATLSSNIGTQLVVLEQQYWDAARCFGRTDERP